MTHNYDILVSLDMLSILTSLITLKIMFIVLDVPEELGELSSSKACATVHLLL